LKSVQASVLGVVLNRVDLHRHSYYYGRYYSPYYGADETGKKTGHEVRESQAP
jgi:Mrp family chromosome partitioning ATPase